MTGFYSVDNEKGSYSRLIDVDERRLKHQGAAHRAPGVFKRVHILPESFVTILDVDLVTMCQCMAALLGQNTNTC